MRHILSLVIFIFAVSVFAQTTTTTTTTFTTTTPAQRLPPITNQPILSTPSANPGGNPNATSNNAPTYGTPVSPEAMGRSTGPIQAAPRTTTTTVVTSTPATTTPNY